MSTPGIKPRPAATPIDILPTDAARLYTHIHPALLLSLYALRFNAIVADPVPALLQTLIPLSALQIAYVTVCLPPTAGSGSSTPAVPKAAKKRASAAKTATGSNTVKIVPALLSLILSLFAITPLTGITLILFGAPITTHFAHTFLAAAHIAILAFLPLVYVLGVDGERWREVVGLLLPVDEVVGGMVGTLVGAWAGAVPIPLDWDREWQKWPVTIVTGAYLGYALGKLAGGLVFKGRKIMFD
ncbi:glycosylphosphatidylinositol anchor biosynthesis protein 11 [Mytilinidion resinicola]|uniref:Glycosylphosphatidylinositol anchor biosynthesis protein 11 n=1 Tax=Mytilinidion resinicola TaxID=574789 RepID=A0A6A6YDX5_9PEZI|nr:glycosylphosphatidylinositol anchor biosynthesis protein 11 [Mytilinidion resinicola]KAF2806285.1 glycosylphosphatidylinositol anchor biosynthesis protein 11 [Mytilinidion resinicola]